MTTPRDTDRLIRAFLDEGRDELPDRAYDAVRSRIDQTRQRVFIGPWREDQMFKYARFAIAAAAIVVVAVVGIQFLPGNGGIGGQPTSSPTPSASTLVPTAIPEPDRAALLPEGPHVLWDNNRGMLITVTIPAPDWYGEPGGGILEKYDNSDAPDGAELIAFAGPTMLFPKDLYVYGDPCHWSTTTPPSPARTVDEAVTVLARQASRNASVPVDVTVAGHAGKAITLHVPDDAVFSDCDQGEFRTLVSAWDGSGDFIEDESATGTRRAQDPGQIDKLWVFYTGDWGLVIIDAAYYDGTLQSVVDELDAIVESATVSDLPD